jgi:GntR family transcriptional regulator of abcA and norABC
LAPYAKWQEPTGGFYIWLKLDPRIKIDALFDAARAQGVLINPGDLYAFHHVQAIRLSYAYAEPAAFAAGCCILKQLIETQLIH